MYSPEVLFIFAVAVLAGVSAHENGAPCDACEHLIPDHGIPPQDCECPWTLRFSKRRVKSGDCVNATIRAKRGYEDTHFKGYVIKCTIDGAAVGTWESYDCNSHVMNCGTGTGNAITHSNPEDKTCVTAKIIAPEVCQDTLLECTTTVVKSHDYYWVNCSKKYLRVIPSSSIS
ncbi:unnamed protein product [Nezara viridula]|uniref:Reelin domain-containing protein n=1 Tax=Nezara viridula TaxID=85310 RepID=A0A9P0E2F7_NEZVI|nr:unnamed protein product [Nezara viridula]